MLSRVYNREVDWALRLAVRRSPPRLGGNLASVTRGPAVLGVSVRSIGIVIVRMVGDAMIDDRVKMDIWLDVQGLPAVKYVSGT